MTLHPALEAMMEDTLTIEPFSSFTSAQVPTFGAAVTYACLLEAGASRRISIGGREVESTIRAYIPGRVFVDQRSRVTLPAGFSPQTPPILGVEFAKFRGLDHTVLLF